MGRRGIGHSMIRMAMRDMEREERDHDAAAAAASKENQTPVVAAFKKKQGPVVAATKENRAPVVAASKKNQASVLAPSKENQTTVLTVSKENQVIVFKNVSEARDHAKRMKLIQIAVGPAKKSQTRVLAKKKRSTKKQMGYYGGPPMQASPSPVKRITQDDYQWAVGLTKTERIPKEDYQWASGPTEARKNQFLSFCNWWRITGDGESFASTTGVDSGCAYEADDEYYPPMALVFNSAAGPNYVVGAIWYGEEGSPTDPDKTTTCFLPHAWLEIDLNGSIVSKSTTRVGPSSPRAKASWVSGFVEMVHTLVGGDISERLTVVPTIQEWEEIIDQQKENRNIGSWDGVREKVVLLEEVPEWLV